MSSSPQTLHPHTAPAMAVARMSSLRYSDVELLDMMEGEGIVIKSKVIKRYLNKREVWKHGQFTFQNISSNPAPSLRLWLPLETGGGVRQKQTILTIRSGRTSHPTSALDTVYCRYVDTVHCRYVDTIDTVYCRYLFTVDRIAPPRHCDTLETIMWHLDICGLVISYFQNQAWMKTDLVWDAEHCFNFVFLNLQEV